MSSSKSSAAAKAPSRKRGELRVAALLDAATSVFGDKGYDAATMTEIAARAGAPIGSLYQFFPSKDVLGEALLERYAIQLDAALGALEAEAAGMSTADLADALLGLFPSLRRERDAAMALIDARPDGNLRGGVWRDELRARLAALLARRAPQRSPEELMSTAIAFLLSMKSIVALEAEPALAGREAALDQMRAMARLYLVQRLDFHDEAPISET
ncbi:helix-turn-helix domain-containing protein [Terrarubrum flagellatum]|uniref:TetR/AcrR family transcriptional regulator n=1 Tax=Terrirubrum flagellatum TaxID=2895980 RepID=UPI0031453515